MRDGDQRRALVDRGLEALERDRPVRLGGHVDYADAAALLGVRDLTDRRKLEVADDDRVAALAEAQAAEQRADAGGDRSRHRDLVLVRVHQARNAAAHGLEPPDPVLPRRAVLVPVVEVPGVRLAHRVGERALRAAVDVDLPLEDREAVPDPSRQRSDINGQGRPCAGPRAGAATKRPRRARSARSAARSHGRRSKARRSRSARPRGSRRRTGAPAG